MVLPSYHTPPAVNALKVAMRRVFFSDTNLLLQCRAVESLPWEQLADGASDVLVVIPRTVQTEIDRLKQDGNARRSRRAREVSSRLREMVRANDCRMSFSSGTVAVCLALAGPRSKAAPRPDDLDLEHNDDRIVDEALAWSHVNGEQVSLLTHDVGMMTTARHFGLPFVEIPLDWLLAPEPDERDKENAALKRELAALKALHPVIGAVFRRSNTELGRLVIEVVKYRDMDNEEVDALVERIREYRPQATSFGDVPPARPMTFIGAAMQRWRPPSDFEIRKYVDDAYPGWIRKVRDQLRGLAGTLEYPTRRALVHLEIENIGSKPAQSARLQLVARGGLMFLPEPDENEAGSVDEQPSFPPPPQPPTGKWVAGAFGLGLDQLVPLSDTKRLLGAADFLAASMPPKPRDPSKFYWETGGHRISEEWELTCQQFMHKVGPFSFQVPVFVPRDVAVTRGALELTIAASNLPEPFRRVVPVDVRYREASIDEVVETLIAKL